jgi:hypothetical protein
MTCDEAAGCLADAGGLLEVLDAAYAAFEVMLRAIDGYHDRGGPFDSRLLMASVPAADGRDALASAPSLPVRSGLPGARAQHGGDGEPDVAAAVVRLAAAVEQKLLHAVRVAAGHDALACQEGAGCARQVCELMAGPRP